MNSEVRYSSNLKRLPSLDGWRAICIVLVLGLHSSFTFDFPKSADSFFEWVFDGELGVRFFFVISGFLITWLMILEYDRNGRVSLWHFYSRRALRILPVYFAFILVLICLQQFTAYKDTMSGWIANLTFTRNFLLAGTLPSGHLWSLSVEEQFYLIWPAIFIFCRPKSIYSLVWISVVPIFMAPVCRALTVLIWDESHCPGFLKSIYPVLSGLLRPVLPYKSYFNFFDSLALGCLAAIVFARKRIQVETLFKANPATVLALALGLIFIPYALEHLRWVKSVVWPLGYTLQGSGLSILLLHSIVSPQSGFYRCLNWSWVCHLGVLSYSIYIWQQLFFVNPQTYGFEYVWWMSFLGWLVPVFVIAHLSYYGLERPLLKLRSRFREA